MKKLIMLCALLGGCVAIPPEVSEGNEASVIVDWTFSTLGTDGALSVADAHCRKYGKHARYNGKLSEFQLAFDCVK